MGKKIIYIVILIIAIFGVVRMVMFFNDATANRDGKVANNIGDRVEGTKSSNTTSDASVQKLATTVTELEDGKLYQAGEQIENADKVMGDNFYDTQINDIYLNFQEYEGTTIEIEGMYIEQKAYNGDPITLVGRYSNANLCQYCSQGYSFFEYQWNGDNTPRLASEISWLKIKGTLKRGEDSWGEYYYIDASSIEVMNERGQDTVNN